MGGKGIGTFMRLIAREPHLADAARLETGLAELYRSIAGLQPEGTRGHVWRQAARLSADIAEALSSLAAAAGDARHNPRPTRIRVATLREADIHQTTDRLESLRRSLGTNGSGPATPTGPSSEALTELVALEGRTVMLPLVRLFGLAPSSRLYNVWQTAALRRRVLKSLGVGGENGTGGWPDPPRHPTSSRSPRPDADTAGDAQGGREWTATGRVERINRSRRCGTARTEDGRTVFFGARAVPRGLLALHPGDAVRLRLRKGSLGLTAVSVELPAPDEPAH